MVLYNLVETHCALALLPTIYKLCVEPSWTGTPLFLRGMMTWHGEPVFLTKLSQPYPPAMCAQYATLVSETALRVQQAEDKEEPLPIALRQHCNGNPMLNSAQCQWMSTDFSDDDDETASAATEMTDLESVTETLGRSSCYENEEDVPVDIL